MARHSRSKKKNKLWMLKGRSCESVKVRRPHEKRRPVLKPVPVSLLSRLLVFARCYMMNREAMIADKCAVTSVCTHILVALQITTTSRTTATNTSGARTSNIRMHHVLLHKLYDVRVCGTVHAVPASVQTISVHICMERYLHLAMP